MKKLLVQNKVLYSLSWIDVYYLCIKFVVSFLSFREINIQIDIENFKNIFLSFNIIKIHSKIMKI